MSCVCPPDTNKATKGNCGGSSLKNGDSKCPSKWCMPITGLPKLAAKAQAVAAPTNNAPASPGPLVKAITSIDDKSLCEEAMTRSSRGKTRRIWSRLANSGTTPPKASCMAAWVCKSWASNCGHACSSWVWTKATPVSSQEDSIPKISM